MEFWGAEVKAGEPLKVEPGDMILHLSQAALGEVKKDKGNESILLYVKVGGQKLVLGTLSSDKCPHISYDLVFEKEFELSHNWKNGSVYFCGYKTFASEEEASGFSDSEDDEEEDMQLKLLENGKPEPNEEESKPSVEKAKAVVKPDSAANKQKGKVVESKKNDDEDDDSDDEDEVDSDEDVDDSDDEEMMLDAEVDSDDEDDEDESSDEEDEATPTPKKAEVGKKRPADSAAKTPASDKKAKLVTPQKTGADGKKGGGHVATPHPAKQAGKTPANNDKSKQQTPKSGGQFSCKPCNKSFNSDNALQSHTKAKHSAGK